MAGILLDLSRHVMSVRLPVFSQSIKVLPQNTNRLYSIRDQQPDSEATRDGPIRHLPPRTGSPADKPTTDNMHFATILPAALLIAALTANPGKTSPATIL